jgi:hypothetical protein
MVSIQDDSVASGPNDSPSSKLRRSTKSPFFNVEPRIASHYAKAKVFMDFAPLIPTPTSTPYEEQQVSFDNTSTSTSRSHHHVGKATEYLPPKTTVVDSVPESKVTLQAYQGSQNEPLDTGFNKGRQRSRRTLAGGSETPVPPKASGHASDWTNTTSSSLPSLQSSISRDSSPERNDHYKHGNGARLNKDASHDARDQQKAVVTKSGRQQVVPNLAFGAAASDDGDTSISVLMQERLLERLDLAAIISPKTNSSVTQAAYSSPFIQHGSNHDTLQLTPSVPVSTVNISTGSIVGKKKSLLAPPRPLPPKAPRKQEQERLPEMEFDHQDNDGTSKMAITSQNLKQYGERVLEGIQGGEFLTESYDEYNDVTSPTPKADLPRKLLERLEAATKDGDEKFMADHYDRDPSLQMPHTTSFGSSTIASAATSVASFRKHRVGSNVTSTSAHSHSSATRKSASCSWSGASRSTTVVTNVSNQNAASNPHGNMSYASFNMSAADDNDAPIVKEMVSSDKYLVQQDRTTQNGTHGAALATVVDDSDAEDQIIADHAANFRSSIDAQKAQEEADELVQLLYLYSQDKEFENSILSPTNSPGPAIAGDPTPSHSPRLLYRSDAINSFWDCLEQIDHKGSTNQKFCPSVASSFAHALDDDHSADAYAGYADDDADAASIVSEKLLNLVTSGCTGVPNPAAKEAIAERLVALEAGWSGFRTQVNERIQYLEESWRSWNLDSLLKCPPLAKSTRTDATSCDVDVPDTANILSETDPVKEELVEAGPTTNREPNDCVITPTTAGSTTLVAAPLSVPPSQRLPSLSRDGFAMTPETMAATLEHASIPDGLVQQRHECIKEANGAMIRGTAIPPKAQTIQLPSLMTIDDVVVTGVVKEVERSGSNHSAKSVGIAREQQAASLETGDNLPSAAEADSFAREQQPETPHLRDGVTSAANNESVELKIMIGSTEQDVPVSLKNTLAEISMIAESHTNASHYSSSSPSSLSRQPKPYLDSSREDSEGGKVILDVADWNSTDDESVYGQHAAKASLVRAENNPLPPFADPVNTASKRIGSRFFFRRRKSSGSGKKKKGMHRSPTSVMAEI